jgi:hypothetical protein
MRKYCEYEYKERKILGSDSNLWNSCRISFICNHKPSVKTRHLCKSDERHPSVQTMQAKSRVCYA